MNRTVLVVLALLVGVALGHGARPSAGPASSGHPLALTEGDSIEIYQVRPPFVSERHNAMTFRPYSVATPSGFRRFPGASGPADRQWRLLKNGQTVIAMEQVSRTANGVGTVGPEAETRTPPTD